MGIKMIEPVKTQSLDHLGIISAVAQRLGLVDKIDQRLPIQRKTHVTMGQRALALILNGLGFMNDRLYLVEHFFKDKPIDRLIAPGIAAEHLNDDVLGDLLDAIHVYGSTRLYSELAFEIAQEQNLMGRSNHLDTTTLSLFGCYEKNPNQEPYPGSLEITYGHSKDHRPDLKQVTLSLTVSGKASFPLWHEALDGNSSDKTSFHNTIAKVTEFQKQLELKEPSIWVADSALYSAQQLLATPVIWITKVPETIGDAKALCQAPDEWFDWKEIGNGYRMVSLCSNYGGFPQRWVLIHSLKAAERETQTFNKKLKQIERQLETTVWHLQAKRFACQADALKTFVALHKKIKYYKLSYQLQEVLKHGKKGRPKKGLKPQVVGYQLQITTQRDDFAIQTALNTKGRFILATNQLDVEQLSARQLFLEYKEQSQAEAGFRFLKDPWFMVNSVFLKNPSRIEALMVIMTKA
jgi:transposase